MTGFSRGFVVAACVAFVGVCGACSKRSKTDAEPVKSVAQEKTKASSSAPSPNAPTADPFVELVDPGKEPRAPMRVKAPQGATQRVDLAMLMAMKMTLAGSPMPSNALPRIHMPMDVKVEELRPDGTRKVTFAVDHVRVESDPLVSPSVVSVLTTKMAALDGMHGYVVVTDRGFNRDFGMEVPPDAPPLVKQMTDSMKQSMGQMVSPFPAEAVGVGAQWRVVTTLRVNGMTMNQTTTYEMVDRKTDKISLKITLKQTADPQDVDSPNLPPGAKVHLESLDSDATGTQQIDLMQVMPASATMKLASDSSMTIDDGSKKQPMGMHMDMQMDVTPE